MNTFTHHRTQTRLRAVLFAFAGLLILQSVWIILPELTRPSPLPFPRKAQSPPISSSDRNRAGRAAELALVRGDLWAEAAIAQSAELIRDIELQKGAQSADQVQLARTTAEKAATLAPHDARIWLLLASLDCLQRRESSRTLKMSYYTGSNEIGLMTLRLLVATCSDAINDAEIQSLATRDIGLILAQGLNPQPAILAAYQNASSSGKSFIESVVTDLDSGLMGEIRRGKRTK